MVHCSLLLFVLNDMHGGHSLGLLQSYSTEVSSKVYSSQAQKSVHSNVFLWKSKNDTIMPMSVSLYFSVIAKHRDYFTSMKKICLQHCFLVSKDISSVINSTIKHKSSMKITIPSAISR